MKIIFFLYLASKNHKELSKDFEKSVNVSPIPDANFPGISYKYELGALSFVLALLCKLALDEDIKDFKDLDEGYLSAEACFGEEEAKELINHFKSAKGIIYDKSLERDKNKEAIFYFLDKLANHFKLSLKNSDLKEKKLEFAKSYKLLSLKDYNGLILYKADYKDEALHCSKQFAQIAKLKNKDFCMIDTASLVLRSKVRVDEDLKGNIAFCKNAKDEFEKIRAIKCI